MKLKLSSSHETKVIVSRLYTFSNADNTISVYFTIDTAQAKHGKHTDIRAMNYATGQEVYRTLAQTELTRKEAAAYAETIIASIGG